MKKNGPWTIKRTEVKYKNPWIEVREDQVIRPDGTDGIYGVVSFVHNGAHALPIDGDGFAYFVKEFAYARGLEEITVAGGACDDDEEVLITAQRELREELGIEAENWHDLGASHPLTSYTNISNQLFLAKNIKFVETKSDPNELTSPYKIPFTDAVSMVMSGEITNEITSLLILKANEYLKSEGV